MSCNTGFARLGVEHSARDKIKDAAQAFGFEDEPSSPCATGTTAAAAGGGQPDRGRSQAPDGRRTGRRWPSPAIGQNDVRMTPLQGALIAAAVANGGTRCGPYLVDSSCTART